MLCSTWTCPRTHKCAHRGEIHSLLHDYAAALGDLTQALTLNPQDALAYFSRGFIYREQGALDRAIADFDKAIELDPQESAGWRNRALARGLTGDDTGAQKDLAQALQLQPTNARTLYISGILQELTGNLMGAISDFTHAQQMTHNAEEWTKIEKDLSHFRPKR